MAKCKDCIHYELCVQEKEAVEMLLYQTRNVVEQICIFFKDKSRFVELPCKVGDWLYLPCCGEITELQVFEIQIRHIFVDYSSGVIKNIIALNENRARMELKFKDVGKTVFKTREEAEKALKERNKNENNKM